MLGVAMVIGVFLLLALASTAEKSVTPEELIHIPAGYAYLKTLDPRLCMEAPPLTGMLCSFPLVIMGVDLSLDHPAWKAAGEGDAKAPLAFGRAFFADSGADSAQSRILVPARTVMAGLGALAGLFLYLLTRLLLGTRCAGIALVLYCLSPGILGHGRLVSPEMPLAAFTLGALYGLARHWRTGGRSALLLTGLGLGLALASSHCAWVLLLVLVLFKARNPKHAGLLLGMALGVPLLVSIGNPGSYLSSLGRFFQASASPTPVFLLGQVSDTGFFNYALVILAVKTPVPTLMLILAGTIAVGFGRAGRLPGRELALVFGPVIGFGIPAVLSGSAAGAPYLFAAFPLLCLLAGGLLAHRAFQTRGPALAIGALAAASAVSAFFAYPHYLSYFNAVAGGTAGGARIVGDKNIDRGQDLPALAAFCRKHRVESIGLALGGPTVLPETFDIPGRPITPDEMLEPEDGWYAVSVSALNTHGCRPGCPIRFDWIRAFAPVTQLGGSLLVFRFLTLAPGTEAPEDFAGTVFKSEVEKKERRFEVLKRMADLDPYNGWVQGRLGTFLALEENSVEALHSLTVALQDPATRQYPNRSTWKALAAWQCLPLGLLSRAMDHLSPTRSAWKNLNRIREDLRKTAADPNKQQDVLDDVHTLYRSQRNFLVKKTPPPRTDPGSLSALVAFCKAEKIRSLALCGSGRIHEPGIRTRRMQPEEVLEPDGWYAIATEVLGTSHPWPGCGVVLDWEGRYAPVKKFGDRYHLFGFRILGPGEQHTGPGTALDPRGFAREAQDILVKSLKKSPQDAWCHAELALRTDDYHRLRKALTADTRTTAPYRLKWLVTGAFFMMRAGEFDFAAGFLQEIRATQRIRHGWLDTVLEDLASLRNDLAQGQDTGQPQITARVHEVTARLVRCLRGPFFLPDRARALDAQGDTGEALALMDRALARVPWPGWAEEAGIWSLKIWRAEDAVSYLEKALALETPATHEALCRALAFRGILRGNDADLDRARRHHAQAVEGGLLQGVSFEAFLEQIRGVPENLRAEIEGE